MIFMPFNKKRHKRSFSGFSIVELMVTLCILAITMGALWGIFHSQKNANSSGIGLILNRNDARSLLKLLENDFLLAGFGQDKNLAFFILDNSQKSGEWSDSIYFSDWRFLGGDEIKSSLRKGQEGGAAKIISGSSSQMITLDRLNLDDYGLNGWHKLMFPAAKETIVSGLAWTNYDNCYGDNCTDDCQNNGSKTCSRDEFAGRIWQTIISDAGVNKVAKINSISGNTLSLDRQISGTKVAPAIYYCLDEGNNHDCDSNANTAFIIKRSDRSSGGRQPLASDIIDMQVAYQDLQGNWYCDGTGPCPMPVFIPADIKKVRISIIARQGASKDISSVKRCVWVNKQDGTCKENNGSGNATCISAENGEPWGCDCSSEDELYQKYYKATISIVPYNTAMEAKITK